MASPTLNGEVKKSPPAEGTTSQPDSGMVSPTKLRPSPLQRLAKHRSTITPSTPLSSIQPFGDFVARVFHSHNPHSSMYQLLSTIATLYLFRCDPDALKTLTLTWARESLSDHEDHLTRSMSAFPDEPCSEATAAEEPSLGDAEDGEGNASEDSDDEGGLQKENTAMLASPQTFRSCSDDERVTHLLSVVQGCVNEYFSTNWLDLRLTLSTNKEFKNFIINDQLKVMLNLVNHNEKFRNDGRRLSTNVMSLEPSIDGSELSPSPLPHQTELMTPPPLDSKSAESPASPLVSLSFAGMAAGYFEEFEPECRDCDQPLSFTEAFRVPQNLNWVGENKLQSLRVRARKTGFVLFFHALFSEPSIEVLRQLAKAYETHADDPSVPELAAVNSASQVDLFKKYHVTFYPFIVFVPPVPSGRSDADVFRMDATDDGHIVYPESGIRQGPRIFEWIMTGGKGRVHEKRIKDFITKAVVIEAKHKFKPHRDLQGSILMLKQLQCVGDHCARVKAHEARDEPPAFIFLGGGMAAGKTTAVEALTKSDWWQKYGQNTVVVNADEFKMRDPLFNAKGDPGSDVHAMSTQYAEQLLVNAINQGRDIIFDGTMSWLPFVEQTVAMVREAKEWNFACGRGYKPQDGIEEYFVKTEKRSTALSAPYAIRMLAIFVEPATAIPRAILRQLTTGRGVPVGAQLRSFRLFADAFTDFCSMCDQVTLFNNNVWIDLEKGELPPVAAQKSGPGQDLVIEDPAGWRQFMMQRHINKKAGSVKELYFLDEKETEVGPPGRASEVYYAQGTEDVTAVPLPTYKWAPVPEKQDTVKSECVATN